MRPDHGADAADEARFPRVSGDAPSRALVFSVRRMFSPRERGCAVAPSSVVESVYVFPA